MIEIAQPQIEKMPTARLVPYAKNPRTHGDAQIAQIAASIREFGFTNPVLIDADDGIIAGHGRVLAASQIGLQEVPCLRLGYLTDAQKRAYVIADNQLPLNAGWDANMLALELNELDSGGFDMTLLGFTHEDLAGHMRLGDDFGPGEESGQSHLDVMRSYTCPSCGHQFTIDR